VSRKRKNIVRSCCDQAPGGPGRPHKLAGRRAAAGEGLSHETRSPKNRGLGLKCCVGERERNMELADKEIFLNLCLHLKVPSKDENLTTLKPWGTQLYIVDRIFWGLAHNRRHFTIVKCGQSGTTSIALAFVLYWL